jgi:hypothetical protein
VKYSLLILFFSFSFATRSSDETIDCIDGKIRYIENKKQIVINDRYCFDSILKTISSTKKCPKNCLVDSLTPILVKHSELHSEVDSPLFKICRLADGAPQAIEYWTKKHWISTSRCLFSDGTYQDINRLVSSRVKYVD